MSEQAWQETNVDVVDEQYEEYQKGKTRIEKPPAGLSVWRILPPRRDAPKPTPLRLGLYVHFVKDPGGVFVAEGICPLKTRGGPCSVCSLIAMLRRSKNPVDIEWAEQIGAKEHIICNAVRLDVKKPEDQKVVIFEPTVAPYKYLAQVLRDKADGIDFTHPRTGKSVKFERTGSSKTDTRYTARLVERASPIPNMAWLEQMHDLGKAYAELPDGLGTRLQGGGLPSSRQVEGATDFPPKEDAGAGGTSDLVEDPGTGEFVTHDELARRQKERRG